MLLAYKSETTNEGAVFEYPICRNEVLGAFRCSQLKKKAGNHFSGLSNGKLHAFFTSAVEESQ